MKLGVRRLGDDLVEHLELRVCPDPVGDRLAEELTIACLRRREHLQADAAPVQQASITLPELRLSVRSWCRWLRPNTERPQAGATRTAPQLAVGSQIWNVVPVPKTESTITEPRRLMIAWTIASPSPP